MNKLGNLGAHMTESSIAKHRTLEKILVVGAGLSGAVVSRVLAEQGYSISVMESRPHIGGNCYTKRDNYTGIMVHQYGPHIFHTDNKTVWDYVSRFAEMRPYRHQVKAVSRGEVFSFPINLHTINQLVSQNLSPQEAKKFIEEASDASISSPKNFEEQALSFIGRNIYDRFFHGYTAKQWGRPPTDLPASILKRLPIRFDYNDNYFSHSFQGMPENGYTDLIENMLNHSSISVYLSQQYNSYLNTEFDHVFYTGPIDAYFEYRLGRLPYRTLKFEEFVVEGDGQGCAVVNYCDSNVEFTRITEHKYFSPWEQFDKSILFKEFSSEAGYGDTPFYPVHLSNGGGLIEKYYEMAKLEKHVSFLGRLGTYRYLDMDVCVGEALDAAHTFIEHDRSQLVCPTMFVAI